MVVLATSINNWPVRKSFHWCIFLIHTAIQLVLSILDSISHLTHYLSITKKIINIKYIQNTIIQIQSFKIQFLPQSRYRHLKTIETKKYDDYFDNVFFSLNFHSFLVPNAFFTFFLLKLIVSFSKFISIHIRDNSRNYTNLCYFNNNNIIIDWARLECS